jgi:ketosteroid isomerase-like protein
MSELDELRARIDQLESRAAITELITAYAIACDEHDIPRLGGLFCTDGVLDTPNGTMVAHGREAIEAMFIEVFKIRGPAFHWTHDVTITFADGDPDRATGLVLCHAETSPNGIASVAALRYHDAYRREGGVWRIASRSGSRSAASA